MVVYPILIVIGMVIASIFASLLLLEFGRFRRSQEYTAEYLSTLVSEYSPLQKLNNAIVEAAQSLKAIADNKASEHSKDEIDVLKKCVVTLTDRLAQLQIVLRSETEQQIAQLREELKSPSMTDLLEKIKDLDKLLEVARNAAGSVEKWGPVADIIGKVLNSSSKN